MTEPVTLRILRDLKSRLQQIQTKRGYNTDAGNAVEVAVERIDPVRSVVIWPEKWERDPDYGQSNFSWPVRIQIVGPVPAGICPGEYVHFLEADVVEAIGEHYELDFILGSTAPEIGETITTGSGSAGFVESITLTSGTWAGNDAVGTIGIRRSHTPFVPGNDLKNSDGAVFAQCSATRTTNNEFYSAQYIGGGTENYPGPADTMAGAEANFLIRFETKDPYQ